MDFLKRMKYSTLDSYLRENDVALPKKGTRTIECDGTLYAWLIRAKPTYCQAVSLTAMTVGIQELDRDTPKVLYVTLNISRPDNWISGHQTQITPAVIRNIIRGALEEGWVPNSGGKAYEFQYSVVKHT